MLHFTSCRLQKQQRTKEQRIKIRSRSAARGLWFVDICFIYHMYRSNKIFLTSKHASLHLWFISSQHLKKLQYRAGFSKRIRHPNLLLSIYNHCSKMGLMAKQGYLRIVSSYYILIMLIYFYILLEIITIVVMCFEHLYSNNNI